MISGYEPIIQGLTTLMASGHKPKVWHLVEAKAGKAYAVHEAKHYKHQLVAGMNYFVKVHVGSEEFIHVRIYQLLSGELELTAVKFDVKLDEPLEYFQ